MCPSDSDSASPLEPEPPADEVTLPVGAGDAPLGETLPVEGGVSGSSDPSSRIDEIRRHASAPERYQLRGRVGRGGQGAVYEVWDEDLHRRSAMKVVFGRDDDRTERSPEDTPPADPETLSRFLEEAQITGQLDHPGVVPIHELGLDPFGHAFFTMRLVRGDDLHKIIGRVHSPDPADAEWTQVRVLGAVLKACEALAYAHAKKVIHRDLKPSNLMIGKFGEAYVMDWGLGRVLGQPDHRDLRIRDAAPRTPSLKTDRRKSREDRVDSPLETMDGRVLGTPSYMSPEQAEGLIEEMGPASDVYSMGAVLYQLLTGRVPYVPESGNVSAHTVLAMVLQGPPKPIAELDPNVPAELVAICEKAMARKMVDRYPDMESLAIDLRSFLEGRVVGAYESGAWAELRKWVRRNRGWATTGAVAILLLIGALGWAQSEWATAVEERENAERAEQAAEEEERKVSSLSDVKLVQEHVGEARRVWSGFAEPPPLWPAEPDRIEAMEAWLEEAGELYGRLPDHKARRDEVAAELSSSRTGDRSEEDQKELEWQQEVLGELIGGLRALGDAGGVIDEVKERLEWARTVEEQTISGPDVAPLWVEAIESIASNDDCPLYNGLEISPQLGLVPLGRNPRTGLWEFWHPQTGEKPQPNEEWDQSLSETGKNGGPYVDGLDDDGNEVWRVAPGNWNRWLVTKKTGLVLVLVPGGEFQMGAIPPPILGIVQEGLEIGGEWEQPEEGKLRVKSVAEGSLAARGGVKENDILRSLNGVETPTRLELAACLPTLRTGTDAKFVVLRGGTELTLTAPVEIGVGSPNIDPWSHPARHEAPVHEVTLPPYFLSKYEMTRGQWSRSPAKNPDPSMAPLGPIPEQYGGEFMTKRNPVEAVSWTMCRDTLQNLGLSLPTEAQWEAGCRGGTSTVFFSGNRIESLQGFANIADRFGRERGVREACAMAVDDGFVMDAPVGSLKPNRFGLHDMHGGVWEWCLDPHTRYGAQSGVVDSLLHGLFVCRGGSWSSVNSARSAYRSEANRHGVWVAGGVRPARAIED